ncbi:PE family protein [Mycobacterium camsae]|uniref:PE family protein n=1 Tax=Mycobacterium gordonae TaxID=1778 RepID=UPI001980218E|nr:PE family protein [Mycobacterium gordonae]
MSAAIAAVFSGYARQYQALSSRVGAFHQQFLETLTGAAESYASAEAANVTLQAWQRDILGGINAPTQALLGRPLIGGGADGTPSNPNGGAGGLLYGDGGKGFSQSATDAVASHPRASTAAPAAPAVRPA